MPDIPEKYKTLREITEAIAKADDEIIENHHVSTQRAKRYGRAVLAVEEYADAKSLVAERTEKATADFLREAAHHDVKHAIHKAEHRLAEARCQAVFKQRPFLQHLDKAREAAAASVTEKISSAQEDAKDRVRQAAQDNERAHAGAVAAGPRGASQMGAAIGEDNNASGTSNRIRRLGEAVSVTRTSVFADGQPPPGSRRSFADGQPPSGSRRSAETS